MDIDDYVEKCASLRSDSTRVNSIIPLVELLKIECANLTEDELKEMDSIIYKLRTIEHSLFWRYGGVINGD